LATIAVSRSWIKLASGIGTSPSAAALTEELALAQQLADAADAISMERFRALDLVVTAKPDLSPVTEADHGIEQAIREYILAPPPLLAA